MLKRIIFRLRDDITASADLSRAFVRQICHLAGVLEDELYAGHLRRGCTLFDAVLDAEAVERMVELFERLKADPSLEGPEPLAVKRFFERWGVEVLVDDAWTKGVQITIKPARVTADKALVLVHGWGGDKDVTFGQMPAFLEKRLGIPVLVYEYPSGWLQKSPSIVFVARNLDNWIRNRISGCRIGVVAHSLGGLTARYLAVLQEGRGTPLKIAQLTLVASPTEGTALATIASKVPFLSTAQIQELQPNSSFLVDLNDRWIRWRQRYVPGECRLGTIYAYEDAVVSFSSAIGLDPDAVPIFGADHLSVVKPATDDHEVILTIERFCRESGLAS